MGFTIETGISAVTVFLQGLLSFFSPCVLPLVPLYLGYLSGGIGAETTAGSGRAGRVRLFIRVLFFALGISAAFFILGLGASAAGTFFKDQRMLFARIGGILVILFGLYQLGVFGSSRVLSEEHRLPLRLEKMTMSPLTALIMGFAFSFAWTPCVGPALASVLLMAGSAQTSVKGFLLIGVYTLGFILPFLAAGIFTAKLLDLFQRHRNVVKYTVKAGGVLMILMGLLMFTGKMNDITGYLSAVQGNTEQESAVEEEISGESGDTSEDTEGSAESRTENSGTEDPEAEGSSTEGSAPGSQNSDEEQASDDQEKTAAYEFELTDQYGETHSLSDYKGKVIFLNFWGTWCPPCRAEMPDIQKLYEEYAVQGEDAEVVILGAAAPGMGQEGSEEEIAQFMKENGYTYPVLMDTDWEMFAWYGITSFPTTFMIDKDGNIFGYVPGQMTEEIMRSIIEQTLEG